MTKAEIGYAGVTLNNDVVVSSPQTTVPASAPAPNIGMVEISRPTQLVPGPPGPIGPTGPGRS